MESDRCIYFNRRAARPAISSLLHFRPPRSKRSRILENLTLNEKWRWKKLWYRQWECMSFSLILFLSFLSPLSLVKNWSKFSNDKLLTFISLVETETLRNSKTIDRIFPFSFFTILTKIVNARLNRFVLIPFFFFFENSTMNFARGLLENKLDGYSIGWKVRKQQSESGEIRERTKTINSRKRVGERRN